LSTSKRQTNLYFSPELHERLRKMAFDGHVSMSLIVERLVLEAIASREPKRPAITEEDIEDLLGDVIESATRCVKKAGER